jgi:hypothetical protein
LCILECQLLLMLCAYFCVNSCDECITPSHRKWWTLWRKWWTLCAAGQNTKKCSWFYEKWFLMWNISTKSLGNYLCEVIFSITGNVMGIPCIL